MCVVGGGEVPVGGGGRANIDESILSESGCSLLAAGDCSRR